MMRTDEIARMMSMRGSQFGNTYRESDVNLVVRSGYDSKKRESGCRKLDEDDENLEIILEMMMIRKISRKMSGLTNETTIFFVQFS